MTTDLHYRTDHPVGAGAGRTPVLMAHALSLAVGAAVFFLLLGLQTLTVHAPFLTVPIGDFAAEQSSYVLIANDAWRFPFLSLPNVNMPEGANAVFFGGTPLLALIARVIGQITGSAPNLIGFWYFLCFVLQAHSFFFLMRQITPRRPLVLAALSLVGVLAYAFLTRFGHVSLFGQFFVIYAMAFVIAATKPDANWKLILGWMAALAVMALLIFAYLAVSIALLFGAALVTLWWNGRMRFVSVIGAGLAFTALLGLIAWSSGYFWAASVAEPTDMSSYSALGLNLGGLVIPPQSVLFPDNELIRIWWEGDFYLGLGALALLAIVVVARPAQVIRGIGRSWPLVAILLVLIAYSLSNRWAFGNEVLFQYTLPDWALPIVGLARSGGRLFWPIGYLIVALAFALSIHNFGRIGVALAVLAMGAYVAEASHTWRFVETQAHTPAEVPFEYAGLQELMDSYETMRLYPSFWCDPGGDGSNKRKAHWQLQITSARAHQSSNSAITVRKMKDCLAEERRMPSEVLRDGEIDIFLNPVAFRTAFATSDADLRAHCREFEIAPARGVMCASDWTANSQLPLPQLQRLSGFALGDAAPGDVISFAEDGNWEAYVANGWWRTSDGPFTWTDGESATLRLTLPRRPGGIKLQFEVYPFLAAALPQRRVDVSIDGQELASWTFDTGGWTQRDLDVPENLTGQSIEISLRQDVVRAPRDIGAGTDPRLLGMAVKTITIEPGTSEQ